MARLIQDQIKRPLAEELLFGKLAGGGQVLVGVATDGSALSLSTLPAGAPALPQSVESE
jgi:ATP-dependent Clp protease ATP-binding subunit ClpA